MWRFNTDLAIPSLPWSKLLLSSFPKDLTVAITSKYYAYVHSSGSVANLDFIISDLESLKKTFVKVSDEIFVSDHSHLEVTVILNFFCPSRCNPKWFQKQLWDRIDVNLYHCVLDDILCRIRIPFHLLSHSQKFRSLELNMYYAEIVHVRKVAAFVAVPLIRVHRNT